VARGIGIFAGVFRYELRMQAHRYAVWIVLTAVGGLLFAAMTQEHPEHRQLGLELVRSRTFELNFLLPVAFGILLSDRLRRERRLKTEELLASLPAGPASISGASTWALS